MCHGSVAGKGLGVLLVSMQLANRHVSSKGWGVPRNMLTSDMNIISTCWLGGAADRLICLSACRRPKRHAGRSTTEGMHQAVLRQRMAMPLPQEAVPSQRETGGQAANLGGASSGPSQLASSLARLQQLEDSELRGPGPDMRQILREKDPSDATAVHSVRRGSGNISGIDDTPASSAPDDLSSERVPTSKAKQMLLLALQRRVADLGTEGNTRGVTNSSPPAPSAHQLEGEHEEREVASQSMQSPLAAGLPKLGPQVIRPLQSGEVASIEKLTQPGNDM